VFYFSGTGNSLWTASALAERLENAQLLPLLSKPFLEDIPAASTVGVVFPVYMHRMPRLVADFIRGLPECEYLYAVAVNAGDVGKAFDYFRGLLSGTDRSLAAGFSVVTPSNYLPFGEAVQGEERDRLLKEAEEKIGEIASAVTRKTGRFDRQTGWFRRTVAPGLLYSLGHKHMRSMDRSFSVDDSCSSCGICEQVCPAENIVLADGKPVWQQRCEMCLACLNLCPESAIQFGKKTRGLLRYRNPYVSVEKLIGQKRQSGA
jgi:ferredoxin